MPSMLLFNRNDLILFLVQFIVQSRNKIADGLNGIKKSISSSIKDPNPIIVVDRFGEAQVCLYFLTL
jgi:hypothetical protein